MIKKIILPFITVAFHLAAFAQTPEEIKKIFPGHDIVCLNYDQSLELSLKEGIPVAERKSNIDLLMLTDKNSNMLSRYRVFHNSYNELTQLNACTKISNGHTYDSIRVTNTKTNDSNDDNIFYADVKETVFDFPSLTQNAIAHVDYTQFIKDAHLLTDFSPPGYLPVANATYTVIVPDNIFIKYVVKNDPNQLIELKEEKNEKGKVYQWKMKNIESKDIPADAPERRYFEPHIIVYISSYEDRNGRHSFLDTIDDLYQWNYSFLKDLNKNKDESLIRIVDSLTAGLSDDHSKAKKIYQWVQQHIRYVAFENGVEGFRPRQAAEVCMKRYGDCKDMSSIITQMLRIAGIKAYYTWIGTRDIPYKYTELALPIVDNHMISTALIDGKWMFLDGTDPNAIFDMPPAFIQGKETLVAINEKEYKILTVPVAAPEKSIIVDSTFIKISDNGIKGTEHVYYNGYFGKDVYTALLYRDEKEKREYVNSRMGKGSNKFILGDYSIASISPKESLASIKASFEIPGYSKKIGNEYYINLNLEKIFENRVIDTAKRKSPMEIKFNYCIRQYHILDIPKGYTVSYLPRNFNFENELVRIDIYYKVEKERVIAAQEVKSKKLLVTPQDFADWNKPMKAVIPFYKETVVLEKK